MNIDYSKITDNPKVIELLKQKIEIENKIKAIDKTALIKHELELLSLPDVVGTLCDHKIYHKNGMVERYNNFCEKCNTHLR